MSTIFAGPLIALGSAVSKTILKYWVGDNALGQEISSEFIDILKPKIDDVFKVRKLSRFFESISEEVAESLDQLTKSGEIKITDNGKKAAILAVQKTFEDASIDENIIIKDNLDPKLLEKSLLKFEEKNIKHLSESEIFFYRTVLRDCCSIVIEVSTNIPKFKILIQGETLKRLDDLLNSVQEILESMPQSSVSSEQKDREFETIYLRSIASKFSKFQIFGLDVANSLKKMDLDVSYINLSVAKNNESEKFSDENEDYSENTKVNYVLSKNQEILISAGPGSGKTTLLQWIALQSSRKSFDDDLSVWNFKIPFYIPLRHYANSELPSIDDFINYSAKNYKSIMPEGWVYKIMHSGNAIVLIDGLDELQEDKRNDVYDWIESLREQFSKSILIITSRPNVLSDAWINIEGMKHLELLPMSPKEVSLFIENWHKAAKQVISHTMEEDEFSNLKGRLKAQVQENYRIRNLASSPLMCAMLCALNFDRNAILPQGRGELYKIFLEVLLERRDAERKISTSQSIKINRNQKEILLQKLAYWMLLNNLKEATISDVKLCFSRAIQMIPSLDNDDSSITKNLTERSGVIREPLIGHIDFIHGTFLEYLAAKEIIEENSINLLVENAHNESWKEVVILAASQATRSQADCLINGLIERGNKEPNKKYILHLLSVASKESVTSLTPDISKSVDNILESLIPPKNIEAAVLISSAGNVVIPFLKRNNNYSIDEQISCIRSLNLIGGTESLYAINSYSKDDNKAIKNEIIKSWPFFNQEEYAEIVLRNINYNEVFSWPYTDSLSGIQHLKKFTKIKINNLNKIHKNEYNLISKIKPKELTISNCSNIANLNFLNNEIVFLSLEKNHIYDFSKISEIVSLESLIIKDCDLLTILPDLSKLKSLKYLSLESCAELSSLIPVGKLTSLKNINLDGCLGVNTLKPLESCKNLESIGADMLSQKCKVSEKLTHLIW